MSLSTQEALRDAYRSAVREHLQRSLRTGEDWDRFNAIQGEAEERLKTENEAYRRDYPARLAEAKQIILREEHGVRLDHPLPPGAMKHADANTLHQKADTRVQRDHQRRCAAIREDAHARYVDLTDDIRQRDQSNLTSNFNQKVQRKRTGPTHI
jgi:hypothetical protein